MAREKELARVQVALDAARGGTGTTLVVEGPPGIGKTSLLVAARRVAEERAMTVLAARATPLERDYPLGVVRQCLEPALRGADDREALLAGAAGLARDALLGVPATPGTALGVLHGLYWLTANLAERGPLVIVVDDAHDADEPSLRFLAYLARRIESIGAALLIGTRAEEAAAAPEALAEIRADPATELLAPRALSAQDVERLLQAVGDGRAERGFAQACHDATGGNPLLLGELVRALRDDDVPFTAASAGAITDVTPPTVARHVRATLERLGAPARALARATAVLGEDAELDVAAELAELSLEEAVMVAAELTRAGILDDATPLRFRHPILASALRADQFASERAAAHARAAALLRRRGAGPERIALQLLHAPPAAEARVVAELRSAAEGARARGAPRTAATLLSRALLEPAPEHARAALLLELGRAEYAAGETAGAAAHLREAASHDDDPLARGQALLALTQANPYDQRMQATLRPLISATLDALAPLDADLALRLGTLSALMAPPGPELDAALERGRGELRGDSPGEAVALAYMLMPLIRAGAAADEVAGVAERAARQVPALLDEGSAAVVVVGIVLALRWSDRLGSAERLLDRVVAGAQRDGSVADYAIALTHRAWVLRRAGRLREAEADARGALAAGVDRGWLFAGPPAVIPLIGCLLDAGRGAEAAQELAAADGDDELPPDPALTPLLLARMRLRAAQGDHRRAAADWDDAVRRAQRLFGVNPAWIEDLTVAAEVHHALGDPEAAGALADQALELAQQWRTPGAIGQALHAQARLRDGDERLTLVRDAVEHLRRSPARLELARALVSLGALLRREGRRSDSRGPLREGYELARGCGADGLAETARHELRASGVRVRREQQTGPHALTPSERRIAGLAAGGASNAEIAQVQFLTVKTVEMHLTSAYRKLGLRSRRDLADALA